MAGKREGIRVSDYELSSLESFTLQHITPYTVRLLAAKGGSGHSSFSPL